MTETSMAVKPISPFASAGSSPKFNTKLKDKEPGKWYLFLQVYEKPELCVDRYGQPELFTNLQLKCRMVDGSRDSVIIDRTLTVYLYKEQAPPDENVLVRLPAYPASFMSSFDSAAKWLFQSEPLGQIQLNVKPACLFQEIPVKNEPVALLEFRHDAHAIYLLTEPSFSFFTPMPLETQITVRNNFTGNMLMGGLTLFTGIPSAQERSTYYKADFEYDQSGGDSAYHYIIFFGETEVQSLYRNPDNSLNFDNNTSLARFIKSDFVHVITQQHDTIARFTIKYIGDSVSANTNKMWDGSDSSTIVAFPSDLKNKRQGVDVVINGFINGVPFLMKTSAGRRVKEFFIRDKSVAILFGKDEPVKAYLFQRLPLTTIKLFTVLSSIPYDMY
jgi:hypothetical protein